MGEGSNDVVTASVALLDDLLPNRRFSAFAGLAIDDLHPPFPTLYIFVEPDLTLAEVEYPRELRPAKVEVVDDMIARAFEKAEVLECKEVQQASEQFVIVCFLVVSVKL